METDLAQAMTAGVFVEAHDSQGNLLGQALFVDWQGRPLPAPGDLFTCPLQDVASGERRKTIGRVLSRHFEVQQQDGEPSVWVRIIMRIGTGNDRSARTIAFSTN